MTVLQAPMLRPSSVNSSKCWQTATLCGLREEGETEPEESADSEVSPKGNTVPCCVHGDGAPAALFAPRILQKRVHVGRLHLFVRPVDAGEASDGVVQEGSVRPVEGHPKQARGFRTLGTGGVERRGGGHDMQASEGASEWGFDEEERVEVNCTVAGARIRSTRTRRKDPRYSYGS